MHEPHETNNAFDPEDEDGPGGPPKAMLTWFDEDSHGAVTSDGHAHITIHVGDSEFHAHGQLDDRQFARLSSLTVHAKPGHDPNKFDINERRLKDAPLDRIHRMVEFILGSPWTQQVGNAIWAAKDEQLPSPGRKPPPEHFLHVAWLWERAVAEGRAPRPIVAKRWGVSEETATRWAKKCRELGLLDAYDHGKEQGGRPTKELEDADFTAIQQLIETRIFMKKLREFTIDGPEHVAEAAEACERAFQAAIDDQPQPVSRVFSEQLLEIAAYAADQPIGAAGAALREALEEAAQLRSALTPDERVAVFVDELSELADGPTSTVQHAAAGLLAVLTEETAEPD